MTRQAQTINQGIQAQNVTAEVMAVGKGATATKVAGAGTEELPRLLEELRGGLARLPLSPPAKQALEEDVAKLDKAATSNAPAPERVGGILESLAGKLKMVGVIVGEAAEIAAPIAKIAGLFGLPLPW